jgi:NADH-ubiquinone oxidoreductase chain 4
MLLLSLLLIPLFGTIFISLFCTSSTTLPTNNTLDNNNLKANIIFNLFNIALNEKRAKIISLSASILNLLISLIIFILFDFSFNQFQFVQEPFNIYGYTLYLGVDGISIYFVLLTTLIVPIALLSN